MKNIKTRISNEIKRRYGLEFKGNTGEELAQFLIENFGQEAIDLAPTFGFYAKKQSMEKINEIFGNLDVENWDGQYCKIEDLIGYGYSSLYLYYYADGRREEGFMDNIERLLSIHNATGEDIKAEFHSNCHYQIKVLFTQNKYFISGYVDIKFNKKNSLEKLVLFSQMYSGYDLNSKVFDMLTFED